ncbi:MAG: hypothetical protein A2W05_01735, partial [Candidatus Schekmanbacteria bacterium RBG_16_38_10]
MFTYIMHMMQSDKTIPFSKKNNRGGAGFRYSNQNESRTDYYAEIDQADKNKWTELLTLFDDASIHQTWSAGSIMKGEGNLSHIVLKKGNEIVGICQVTLTMVPLFNIGVADVYNGPIWRKKGCDADIEIFCQMIASLKHEYALNRKLFLRIWPNEFDDGRDEFSTILERLGFRRNISVPHQRTLLLDISTSLEILRKNLGKTWRYDLMRAEKDNLCVTEGTGDDLYEVFLIQLGEMLGRKGFMPRVNYDKYRIIQKELPESLKMKIMVAEVQGRPVCSIICSAIGNTGIFLFGATADEGLKSNASKLL